MCVHVGGGLGAYLIGATVWALCVNTTSGPSTKQVEPVLASLLLQIQDWNGVYDQNWENSES